METHEPIKDVNALAEKVASAFLHHRSNRLFTAAISGIDGSGKGYMTKLLQDNQELKGYKVANINIDPWQNPIPVRIKKENTAINFYHNVFRWNDFFTQLIFPLQHNRSIYLPTKLIRTDADEYYPFTYEYEDLDILLIEGICLFQQQYIPHFDLTIWIECSFETALERAKHRNIEQIDEEQLVADYHNIYYAAQRLHFKLDMPQKLADIIFDHEKLIR